MLFTRTWKNRHLNNCVMATRIAFKPPWSLCISFRIFFYFYLFILTCRRYLKGRWEGEKKWHSKRVTEVNIFRGIYSFWKHNQALGKLSDEKTIGAVCPFPDCLNNNKSFDSQTYTFSLFAKRDTIWASRSVQLDQIFGSNIFGLRNGEF